MFTASALALPPHPPQRENGAGL